MRLLSEQKERQAVEEKLDSEQRRAATLTIENRQQEASHREELKRTSEMANRMLREEQRRVRLLQEELRTVSHQTTVPQWSEGVLVADMNRQVLV